MIERVGRGLFGGAEARVGLRACEGPSRLRVGAEAAAFVECTVHSLPLSSGLQLPSGPLVRSVEHLAAALGGLGLHHGVEVELLQGDELPLLDGAAAEWAQALAQLGVAARAAPARIARAFEVEVDGSQYRFTPDGSPQIGCHLRTEHPQLVRWARWDGAPRHFVERLAPARTFVFERDLEAYRARGVAVTVRPEQFVLVRADQVQSAGMPASPDEPVRHKLLDLIGDLFVHGGLGRGRLEVTAPGHARTHRAVALAKRAGAWVSAACVLLLAAPAAQAEPVHEPPARSAWRRPVAPPTHWEDQGPGARLAMPELGAPGVRMQLQTALGALFGQGGEALRQVSLVQRNSASIDVPVYGRSVHLGMRYSWAAAQGPRAGMRSAEEPSPARSALVSGNNEAWVRVLWAHPKGLAVGGALELVLPTATTVRGTRANDAAAAARALSVGNWLSFWSRAFGVRPAIDVRVQRGGFTFQFRQALSFAIGLDGGSDSADTIAAESSVYLGQRVGRMQLGLELSELYFLDRLGTAGGTRRDAARPRFSIAPQLALDCGRIRPHFAVLYSPVSSYDDTGLLGAQLSAQLLF